MGWYRVKIIKNKKIIVATCILSDREQDAIKEMKENYPYYNEHEGYMYCSKFVYDGH